MDCMCRPKEGDHHVKVDDEDQAIEKGGFLWCFTVYCKSCLDVVARLCKHPALVSPSIRTWDPEDH